MCTRFVCLIVDYYQHIIEITFDSSKIKMILFDVYASRINSIFNIYNDNTMYVCFMIIKTFVSECCFFLKNQLYMSRFYIILCNS